jgi:hypothetical protein
VQNECPCRSEKRNQYLLQGNSLTARHRHRTRCPVSDILSIFFTFVSGHRPTPNSDTREGSGSRPGSVSCTGFSTVFTDTKEMHQGELGLLHPGDHARSRRRCGIRACRLQSVIRLIKEIRRDEPPSRARKGCECHHRNSSVRLSTSHDSQGWKRT